MQRKLTVTGWMKNAIGKTIQKTGTGLQYFWEDRADWAEYMKAHAKANGVDMSSWVEDMTVPSLAYNYGGFRQCSVGPKVRRHSEGVMVAFNLRNKEFAIRTEQGDISASYRDGATLTPEGDLVITYPNGLVMTYHIKD